MDGEGGEVGDGGREGDGKEEGEVGRENEREREGKEGGSSGSGLPCRFADEVIDPSQSARWKLLPLPDKRQSTFSPFCM